jgi:2-polyprenyl-6-methoxyphenol hydroxylase-like FAD-dependent oxidoreductase
MYDAIIIGARCAGSPTAMLLARKGYRVLLVDRATFPSDTMSTHYVHQPGIAYLKRWGLLDQVAASNCPPISKITFDLGDFSLTGCPLPADGVVEGYCPRRKVLDKILVDAAVAAGAELRQGFAVQEMVMDGDQVTGIRGRTKGGSTVTEAAHITIGADGMHSIIARIVTAPEYNVIPSLSCNYYTYWSGLALDGVELYSRDGRFIVAMPTNDSLTVIIALWTSAEFHQYRADVEGNYLKTLELVPQLAELVRSAKREERFVGTGDLVNFFRKPYGPGWALVGDAGYHKDPITAQGMTDAFRDAEVLAEAIDAGLSGRRPLEEALADYERQRNEAVGPMYEFTCQQAALAPLPPEMRQLFAALRGNQAETDRFFGTLAGTVSIPEFFSPESTERILSSALQPG